MDEIPEDQRKEYVRQFLKELKWLIDESGLIVADRVKNRDALLELGLTARQREEIVLSLSVQDYCSGPTADEYEPGQYYVFGNKADGVEIYIKLKISESSGAEYAVCLSFHKAERPLIYPFNK